MFTIIIILFIIIIFISLFIITTKKNESNATEENLYKQKALMTPNELDFFSRLTQALPELYVFPQVSLGALLQPNIKGDNKKYYSIRGTFAQKVSDYVVCTKDIKIVAIIELDDKTHNTEKDSKRDEMLKQAGYKVVRWNSKDKPTTEEIKTKIHSLN